MSLVTFGRGEIMDRGTPSTMRRGGGRAVLAIAIAMGLVAGLGLHCPALAAAAVARPGDWGFEQVTPSRKGGGNVQSIDTFQTSADGNRFLLSASGPFESVPAESAPLYTRYLARRTPTGWANRALDVPFDPIPPVERSAVMTVVGTSGDLAYALVASSRALAPGAIAGGGNVYLRDTATGAYRLVAAHPSDRLAGDLTTTLGTLSVKYVAADGKAVVFLSKLPLVDGMAEGVGASYLYRWTESGGLEAVSKLPESEGGGYALVGSAVGNKNEFDARQSLPRADGASTIFFQSVSNDSPGPAYRWSGGVVTVVSKSQIPGDEEPAVAAGIRATTSGGEFALIQTQSSARLTSDTPTFAPGTPGDGGGRIIYRYESANSELRYVGVADPLTFESIEQMSADGQTVVFKTKYQLTPDAPAYDSSDDSNNRRSIYVWKDGALHFVATADPNSRADNFGFLRVLSESGRYFAFTDNSQGTASRFGITDNTSVDCAPPGSIVSALCDQVYVFDTERPGSLECASCRPADGRPRGSSGDPGIVQGAMLLNGRQVQTVSDDGTVFFTSAVALADADSNGLLDVYSYRDGRQRLVSGGVQGASARFLDATPDGASIFFATNAQLADTDTDRAVDVYVTRLGAGYADQRPSPPPACVGGDCRAPDSVNGAVPGGAGNGTEADLGEPSTPDKAAKVRVRLIRTERRKGTLRVSIRTTGAGRLRISGGQVKTTVRNPGRAGDLTVSVPLSKEARTTIRRNGRLRARIRVSLAPPFGSSAVSTSTRTVR
jgi:hypothetical protein